MSSKPGTKPLLTIHEQRQKALRQKEETLQTVLTTAKTNPKFIKLLIYSLNSLEGFISPPNREIRVNASIVIRLEGLEILRMITTTNITNEQIVSQAGNILWKLISINDIVDPDLAKLFADKNGHKAVIEILVKKDKAIGASLPYIRILNGLAQIPQLISKLLDSDLMELVKKINELYPEDLDIISLNFDTMKKISSQKAGRDLIIKNGLIKSILENITQCAKAKNTKGVLSGLTLIDNLSRNENGKEAIIAANGIEYISNILDMYENDDRILKKCAKIYSKIAKNEDMLQQLILLKKYYAELQANPQCENFKEISKSLVLISNFMLVEEIGKTLMEADNFKTLCDLFNFICKINLEGKSTEYIQSYVLLNKYFMVIFNRLHQTKQDILEQNKEVILNIENSLCKNWKSVKKIVEESKDNDSDFMKSFMGVFRQYFCSYNGIIYQCHKKANDAATPEDANYINMLLYMIQNIIVKGKQFFDVHLESNYAASRVLKSAIAISQQKSADAKSKELSQATENVYNYLLTLFNISEHNPTLTNVLDVLYYLMSQPEFKQRNLETLIPIIVNFMNTKQKYRYPNLICMRILDFFLTPEFIDIYLKKPSPNTFPTHGLNYVQSIVSVMTKQFYQTSTVLKVFSSAHSSEEQVDFYSNETVENEISSLGAELLKRLIDMMELKKILKTFKEIAASFNPQDSNSDAILSLESSLLTLYSIIGIKDYFTIAVNEILEPLKALIAKEITYVEGFKRDKVNEKNPNYKDIIISVSKRLTVELELSKMIYSISVQREEYQYIISAQDIFQNVLLKSSDTKNLNRIVPFIQSYAKFLKKNERELKPNEKGSDSLLDKIGEAFLNCLRRLIEEEEVVENVIKSLIEFVELKNQTCNYLVKGGCPRLLIQVMETTSKPKVAGVALKLLKLLAMSNEQNLQMVANSNALLKLFEIRAKFINEERITADCDLISSEILKLPEQENYANEVLLEAITDFNQTSSGDYKSNDIKVKLLNSLEVINAFASNKKQIEFLVTNKDFLNNLNEITEKTIKETEVSQINEKLLNNELSVYKKLKENVDNFDQGVIVDKLLDVIMNKSNYSDIIVTAAKSFSSYLKEEDLYDKYLKGKLNNNFIDHLFEINENYLDDPAVSKEINNILCYLCLRDATFADYIKTKGGLANVIEELKQNLSSNDYASQQMKLYALKMLDSLCRDDKSIALFLKANGIELLNNMIKNELSLYPQSKDKEIYMTNEPICTKEKKTTDFKQETYFSYCVTIIKNGLEKGYKEFLNEQQLVDLIHILNAKYPNQQLYQEITEICLREDINLPSNENDVFLLLKCALSIEAISTTDFNLYNLTLSLMKKMGDKVTKSSKYVEGLKKELYDYIAKGTNNDNLAQMNKLATYLSLAIQLPDFITVYTQGKEAIVSLYTKLINIYGDKSSPINDELSDGVVISMMLLCNYILSNTNEGIDLDLSSKFLFMGLHYYDSSNSIFALEFLKEFELIFDVLGKQISKDPITYTDDYLVFLKTVYKKCFGFFDKVHSVLKETRHINSLNILQKDVFNRTLKALKSYFLTPEESNDKQKEIKTLCTSLFNLIDDFVDASGTINPEEFKAQEDLLWDIINLIFHQDFSKSHIIEDEEIINKVFLCMNKCKGVQYENIAFNEIMNGISLHIENAGDVLEKIIKLIEEDFKCTPKKHLEINLRTLANLSRYASALKVILKSSSLWSELNNLYSTEKDMTNRRLIATINSNVMKNSYNIDFVLSLMPETFKVIGQKIAAKDNIITDSKDFDIAEMEIDTICLIMQDQNNYLLITQKGLISNDDLLAGVENYKGKNDALSAKITELMKRIDEMNQSKKEEINLQVDEEQLNKLTSQIELAFDEHLHLVGQEDEKEKLSVHTQASSELPTIDNMIVKQGSNEQLKKEPMLDDFKKMPIKRQQSKIVTAGNVIQSNSSINESRLSIISKTLFFNESNGKIVSPLSIRNSQQMSSNLETILSLIRLMYNSNKISQDATIKSKRESLILDGLRLIKMLSICEDNHYAILDQGLMNFIDRIAQDNIANKKIYIASLDILKNCTISETTVLNLIGSPLLDKLLEEVLGLYTKPEQLVDNDELSTIFLYDNMTFSNVCRRKKGFEVIFKKIGLDKLRQIGTVTGNVVILTAIIDMIINYLQNNANVELSDEFVLDVVKICEKALKINDRTAGLVSKTIKLFGMIYQSKNTTQLESIDIVPLLLNEFTKYKCEPDFVLNMLYTLAIVVKSDVKASNECVDSKLLSLIVDEVMNNSDMNDILIEYLSLLYRNLVCNNQANCAKLCTDQIVNSIIKLIEKYSEKCKPKYGAKAANVEDYISKPLLIENRILTNLIYTLDSLTGMQISLDYLAKSSSFLKTLLNTIEKASSDIEIVKISLHSIGNYFYKETKKDWKHSEIEQLYTILKNLHKSYYANSEILISINHICGYILKGFDSMVYTMKFYNLILESLKSQDWNLPLVLLSLSLIKESLEQHADLVEDSFEETRQHIHNLLIMYFNDSNIQSKCYDILAIYSTSPILAFFIIKNGLMPIVQESFDNDDFNSNDTVCCQVRNSMMNLLCLLGTDENSAKQITITLLEKLIKELLTNYSEDKIGILKVIAVLVRHKYCVDPFLEYTGLSSIIKISSDNPTNVKVVVNCFKIIGSIAYMGEDFRKMLQDNQFNDLLNEILAKAADIPKIVFEAKALHHLLNLVRGQKSGKEYKEIDMAEIRTEKMIKNEVKAFLTVGKVVKMITPKGKVKEKHLVFSQDLLKVMCKNLKSNIPPKPHWVIETLKIQKIVKGHGTEAFKTQKGLFKSVPKLEKCFSIIGPITIDGVKSFNAICETEEEVNQLVKYLELAFNYLVQHKGV